jgi:hypothetical protein
MDCNSGWLLGGRVVEKQRAATMAPRRERNLSLLTCLLIRDDLHDLKRITKNKSGETLFGHVKE